MILWHLLALGVLTAVARVVPRLVLPYAISSDAFYHLLAADRIRANDFRIPARLRGLFFPGPYDYPPVFHWLLALCSPRVLPVVERFVSAGIDILYVWLGYGFLAQVLHDAGGLEGAVALERAFVVAALFSVSPALLYTGRGPRAHNANPRIFSELVFGGVMVGTYWWYVHGTPWALAASVVLAALLLLSSKFGTQVLVFFFPLLALVLAAPSLLLVPVGGFLLALVPFHGHYLNILKGHLGHLALFARIGRGKGAPMAHRSEWRQFVRLLGSPARLGTWYHLTCINSISCYIVRNPHLFVIALWWDWRPGPATSFLVAWIAVSLVVFLVITARPLLFLGEPERYVSYSLLAQFALLALAWTGIPSVVLAGLTIYSLLASAAYQTMFIKLNHKRAEVRASGRQVLEFLRAQPRVRFILPVSEGPYNLAYTSDQEVFYPCGNFQVWHTPVEEYRRIYEDFLRPRRETLFETVERYGIDTLLINKRNDLKQFWRYVHHCPVLFENETFVVYDVSAPPATSSVSEAGLGSSRGWPASDGRGSVGAREPA